MKNRFSVIFFTFLPVILYAQVTFILNKLPENTPKNTQVYISGEFEGWTGGQEKYRLEKKDDHYQITLPENNQDIQFKFTMGSWESVETDRSGNNIDNRNYTFKSYHEKIYIKISGWNNPEQKISTASKNVTFLTEEFYIPQLNRKRRIWLYLPPDYQNSRKRYPVIYMHDGQNLFDSATSFAGEWEVDETLNRIYNEKGIGFIVIGIDNGGKKRLDEYSPWINAKYGGGEGGQYVSFIVKTLKPYIDQNYRTLSEKQNTVIFGSSMGGLISFYAGLHHPEVFGKIGAFSPSFWFSDKSFDDTKDHGNLRDSRLYFLAGNKEGEKTDFDEISQTVTDMNKMIALLKQNGFDPDNITSKVIPEGKHNEKMWKEYFKEAVLWLFDI
jgi:alpha-glucosidase